jgi:DNA primase
MSVQVVTLPEGEDPDSFVDKQGGAALREQLTHAINVFERKVQLLQRAGWFADLTTKRRALDRLLPTIRATSDPLMREIYLTRTAEVAGVAKEILEREVEALPAAGDSRSTRAAAPRLEPRINAPAPGARARGAAPRSGTRAPASERDLVWILLHDRAQVEAAGEQVGPDDLSDPSLRDILRAIIAADPSLPSSELAVELAPESVPLYQELLERPLLDGIDTGSLMSGCLAHIRAALIERRLDAIDGEIRIASPEEQDALLAEKQRLHREVVALGVRRYKSFAR